MACAGATTRSGDFEIALVDSPTVTRPTATSIEFRAVARIANFRRRTLYRRWCTYVSLEREERGEWVQVLSPVCPMVQLAPIEIPPGAVIIDTVGMNQHIGMLRERSLVNTLPDDVFRIRYSVFGTRIGEGADAELKDPLPASSTTTPPFKLTIPDSITSPK